MKQFTKEYKKEFIIKFSEQLNIELIKDFMIIKDFIKGFMEQLMSSFTDKNLIFHIPISINYFPGIWTGDEGSRSHINLSFL